MLKAIGKWLRRFTHPKWTRGDVADILDRFVHDRSVGFELDDLTYINFTDPLALEVQQRVIDLPNEFPSREPGEYCSSKGKQTLVDCIQKLRKDPAVIVN